MFLEICVLGGNGGNGIDGGAENNSGQSGSAGGELSKFILILSRVNFHQFSYTLFKGGIVNQQGGLATGPDGQLIGSGKSKKGTIH